MKKLTIALALMLLITSATMMEVFAEENTDFIEKIDEVSEVSDEAEIVYTEIISKGYKRINNEIKDINQEIWNAIYKVTGMTDMGVEEEIDFIEKVSESIIFRYDFNVDLENMYHDTTFHYDGITYSIEGDKTMINEEKEEGTTITTYECKIYVFEGESREDATNIEVIEFEDKIVFSHPITLSVEYSNSDTAEKPFTYTDEMIYGGLLLLWLTIVFIGIKSEKDNQKNSTDEYELDDNDSEDELEEEYEAYFEDEYQLIEYEGKKYLILASGGKIRVTEVIDEIKVGEENER